MGVKEQSKNHVQAVPEGSEGRTERGSKRNYKSEHELGH